MEAINVMSLSVTSIGPTAPIEQAHAMMLGLGARHLPVVRAGRLVGILSDRDVLLRVGHTGKAFVYPPVNVDALMSVGVITAELYTPVAEIAHLMITHKIDAVPIVTLHGDLVGIVTSTDLLRVVGQLSCAPGVRCA